MNHGSVWLLPLVVLLVAPLALPPVTQAASNVYLLQRHWQPYDMPDTPPSTTEVSRSQRGLGWHWPGATRSFGVDYDYQTLRIRSGEPAHNGHLHRLTFGGHWQQGPYRAEARAGFAGTSNMLKYQRFHSKAVNGRVALFRALAEDSSLSLGVGGDHRFGSFRWLPRVRWQHGNDRGHWLVDLPVMVLWQSPDERWEFLLERKGDRWATLDRDRELESALYLREWRAELKYRIIPAQKWRPAVVLGLGASMATRARYQDLQAGTLDQRLGDTLLGTIRLDW